MKRVLWKKKELGFKRWWVKVKIYSPLFERVNYNFKAWYSPSTDKLYRFDENLLHSEKSYEYFHLSEDQALEKNYIRVYFYNNELNILSYRYPEDRVFVALKYKLKDYITLSKLKRVVWEVSTIKNVIYTFNRLEYSDAEGLKWIDIKK